jgi:hypothetical protein
VETFERLAGARSLEAAAVLVLDGRHEVSELDARSLCRCGGARRDAATADRSPGELEGAGEEVERTIVERRAGRDVDAPDLTPSTLVGKRELHGVVETLGHRRRGDPEVRGEDHEAVM